MPKLFGKEVSATTLGLLGAGLGGILGASGSKGQTSGTQGYAGGIPDYTATRNLAPNAFASTITDPITQEVRARRPGEAGRQYFTDALGQSRVNFTRGANSAILGGAELNALNATNLAQQKELDAAGAELLGIASLNQQGQIAGGVGEGTGIAAGAEVVPTAGVPAAGTGIAAGVPAAGAGVPAAAAGAGVPAAGAVDPNAAFNSFISPFFNQVDGLTPAQLIQLGASNFDLATIASTLDVDATALSNAIAQATNNAAAATADAGVVAAADAGGVAADAGVAGTGAGAAVDPNAAFNSFISPFSNQTDGLTPAQLIALGDSNFDLANIASTLDVDQTELSGAITKAQDNAEVESVINMVDPSNISEDDAKSVSDLILDGKTGITDVAGQFENVSDMDVIEGMIRGGYESPAAMTKRLEPTTPGLTEVELMASLLSQGRTTPEELAAYYGNNAKYPEYAGVTAAEVRGFAKDLGIKGYAAGGDINGYYLGGTTDGMADNVPATIDNQQPAALSDGEFVIPADVVSHLGNGNSDSGAQNLYSMMERVRTDRTGNPNQGNQIDPNQYLA
jgi:hypothetical protein